MMLKTNQAPLAPKRPATMPGHDRHSGREQAGTLMHFLDHDCFDRPSHVPVKHARLLADWRPHAGHDPAYENACFGQLLPSCKKALCLVLFAEVDEE